MQHTRSEWRRRATATMVGLSAASLLTVGVAAADDFTAERLGNLAYRGPVDPDHAIQLRNGRYLAPRVDPDTGARPVVTLQADPIGVGDVDGDGNADAVVVLVEDDGDGDGPLPYLAVVSREGGRLVSRDAAPLDRGAQVESLRVQGGEILVGVAGADRSRVFVLEDSGLAEHGKAAAPARKAQPVEPEPADDGELILEPYPPKR